MRCAATALLALSLIGTHPADAAQPGTTLTDSRGMTHQLAAPPQRIISLVPSVTEGVCALGACERLVGVDRHSNWPAPVRALPRLGGLDDAPVERIVALKPDVVLLADSPRLMAQLERLGVRVVVLRAESHTQVREALLTLGLLLGRPDEAEQVWRRNQAQLEQARQRLPAAWQGRSVYFEVSRTPHAAGEASFIGQTLARLGLRNIVGPQQGAFPQLNPEFVIRAQPDVLMAAAEDAASFARRPGWDRLEALRQQRVCAFAAEAHDVIVRPGPRMGEAALLVADCLAGMAPAAR